MPYHHLSPVGPPYLFSRMTFRPSLNPTFLSCFNTLLAYTICLLFICLQVFFTLQSMRSPFANTPRICVTVSLTEAARVAVRFRFGLVWFVLFNGTSAVLWKPEILIYKAPLKNPNKTRIYMDLMLVYLSMAAGQHDWLLLSIGSQCAMLSSSCCKHRLT